ncbi:AAA family ATPase [Verrucomicrobiota bacterium sgz303538]
MREKITHYIRAGYAGLYLVSHEEQRVEAELKRIADSLQYQLFAWSVTAGLIDTRTGASRGCQDPMEAVSTLGELPENSVVLLRDFQPFLDDPNPILIRQLKDQIRAGKLHGRTVAVLGCRLKLSPELEREFTVIDFALPDAAALQQVLEGIVESTGKPPPDENMTAALIDAARGLTTTEAEDAFALSVVEAGELSPVVVAREKAQAVRKNGLLELIETKESLGSIGGLDQLKEWLLKRREAFSPRAVEYGLPTPKGVLMLGVPGCGKSLTAKATANIFGIPLLRLDAGRIFAGLVGQSEANLRSVIQTSEAIAPCVLWVDELEKAFAGSRSSGSSDGGTASRVFGSFLSWLQEKQLPVFIVATANDVSQLPPEMLRKGRLDELFFVDLPTREEREAIWSIQIRKFRRDPSAFDLRQLAKATEGFTGSEIEQVFAEALYRGFDRGEEPGDLTIGEVLVDFVPLSKLMGERMSELRSWATGRARPATTPNSPRTSRKIAA